MALDDAASLQEPTTASGGGGGGAARWAASALAVLRREAVQLKWRAVIPLALVGVGHAYVFDLPGSIGMDHYDSIQARFLAAGKPYTQQMNQALYSVYAWPNVALSVGGGLLIDKYLGIRRSLLIFEVLVLGGSLILYAGILATSYPLLIAGRLVYGFGGESLFVSIKAYVVRWFGADGVGIALAFGVVQMVASCGGSGNFLLSPVVSREYGVAAAALAGAAACGMSLLAAVALVAMDRHGVRAGVLQPESRVANATLRVRDCLRFPLPYWLVVVVCTALFCTMFPLVSVLKNFLEVKYGLSGADASNVIGVASLVSIFLAPVAGLAVDGSGRLVQWLLATAVCFAATHVGLIAGHPDPHAVTIWLYALVTFFMAALYPAVPLVVPAELCGLAYGVMNAVENGGLSIVPLISGAILDAYTPTPPPRCNDAAGSNFSTTPAVVCTNSTAAPLPSMAGFVATEWLFLSMAVVGAAAAAARWVVDRRRSGGILSASPAAREGLERPGDERPLLGGDAELTTICSTNDGA
jgi:MFS family permease